MLFAAGGIFAVRGGWHPDRVVQQLVCRHAAAGYVCGDDSEGRVVPAVQIVRA